MSILKTALLLGLALGLGAWPSQAGLYRAGKFAKRKAVAGAKGAAVHVARTAKKVAY